MQASNIIKLRNKVRQPLEIKRIKCDWLMIRRCLHGRALKGLDMKVPIRNITPATLKCLRLSGFDVDWDTLIYFGRNDCTMDDDMISLKPY